MMYLAKHLVCLHFASGVYFAIWFDLDAPGVYAGTAEIGCLAFGEGVLQENLDCSGDSLRAKLRFDGEWMPVSIPWRAIKHVLTGEQYAARLAAGASLPGVQYPEQHANGRS